MALLYQRRLGDVAMSYEDFEALADQPENPQRAFKTSDLSVEEAARIIALLEQPLPEEKERPG